MAENQLIFGLKRRYAVTLGFIAAGEDRADDLRALAHVILMFHPGARLSAIRPIRPYREDRQRWSRDALGILRRANGPMTAHILAKRVLMAQGKPTSRENMQRVECSLLAVLRRLEGRGVVRTDNEPMEWAIEP